MEPVRYGVFAAGPLWQLVTADGSARAFADRATAISQAQEAARASMARGRDAEVLVQQQDGTLVCTRLARPAQQDELRTAP
jgi:hypothetical protein